MIEHLHILAQVSTTVSTLVILNMVPVLYTATQMYHLIPVLLASIRASACKNTNQRPQRFSWRPSEEP